MPKKILIPLLITVLALFFLRINNYDLSSLKKEFKSNNVTNVISNKNDFAFLELTIPYLRNRSYKSQLNEINSINQSSDYINYLTSYNSDGLRIGGLLTIPKGEAPQGGFPAIVFVHGYIPPETYKTTEKYVAYVDYLARNGFVVFKIDLRGHGSSEGGSGGAYYSSDYVIDTLNAYNALQNANRVNRDKVGIWGHSMAGNIVLRSVAVKKDIPAVVVWAGAGYTYQDFLDLGIGDNSYRPPINDSERAKKRRQLMEYYGQFNPESWFWKQVPATNYLDGVSTKLQLHHAVDDTVVDIEYSRNLNMILNNTQIVHNLNEYQSGEHNISGNSFSKAMQKTVEFFNDNL